MKFGVHTLESKLFLAKKRDLSLMKDPGQTEFENPYFFLSKRSEVRLLSMFYRYGVSRGVDGRPGTSYDGARRRKRSHHHLLLNVARKKRYYLPKRKKIFEFLKPSNQKTPNPYPTILISLSISQMVLPDNKDAYHQKVSQYLPDEQKIHFFASFSSTILACKKWALFGCFSPKIRVLAQSFQFLKTKRVCFACHHIIMSSQ